jgi:hypothetical protein
VLDGFDQLLIAAADEAFLRNLFELELHRAERTPPRVLTRSPGRTSPGRPISATARPSATAPPLRSGSPRPRPRSHPRSAASPPRRSRPS